MKKRIEYKPYDKEKDRSERGFVCSLECTDPDQGFEEWREALIDMYKTLTGIEPEIFDGRYWMANELQGWDLLKMYYERYDDHQYLNLTSPEKEV